MSDWIGLAVLIVLAAAALIALSQAGKSRPPSTKEEYERRVAEGPGLLGASMTGLQQILDPAAKKAAVARQDFEQGFLDEEQKENGE
jgi:hypothetical protein